MMCFILCFGFLSQQPQVPTDSYCQVYQRVILQKGDGTIQATSGVKRRLLANELTFKKICQAAKTGP